MTLLIANIPAIICYLLATLLIYFDKSGWGWLIFAGIMLSHVCKNTSEDDV